jgi:MtN3 and saliva related transmembrane protein
MTSVRVMLKGDDMQFVEVLGFVAGACTTAAFLPQVIQVWRTRSAADISLWMYCVFLFGVSLWLAYGFVVAALPLILTNLVTLLLAGAVLVMKLRFEGVLRFNRDARPREESE